MSISQVLKFGRTIGLENFSQLKSLARTVQSGKPFKYNLHLNINQAQADEFTKAMVDAAKETRAGLYMPDVAIEETIAQAKRMFPVTTAKENNNIIDVAINRFAPKSGSVKYSAKTLNPAGDVVANADAKFLANEHGMKASINTNVPEQNYAVNGTFSTVREGGLNMDDVMKALKMDVKDGLFTAKIPQTKSGRSSIALDVKANEKFMDSVIQSQPNGLVESTKDLVEKHQKLIS